MLLVHLEIIHTSSHSMTFKTHAFSLYAHLCIYVSMYLYSYLSTDDISQLAVGGGWEQVEVHLKITIE